ncbi:MULTISPECIES: hypothetical protein [Paenibacillus]|uniref:hypothetical protein n=1 Tax=Paenibacillus TaxID=44249 RepID=UPI0022B91170|nr:hypothetical protein [Paenibacillus caseinilyticus]MCZ8520129.1 hypothetical protein [Paenibacillus caseinilyticus]
MTPVILIDALRDRLQALLAEYQMETKEGQRRSPQVVTGYLPQQLAGEENPSEYPFIIVRPFKGKDAMEGGHMSVRLIFGTYRDDDDGFYYVMNLMERVRQHLQKRRGLGGVFRLELPYEWQVFEEQPMPHWVGEAITLWSIPTIQEEVEGI